MIDYYGEEDNYIHIKFGRMQKMYNFPDAFREKYPNFCAEYDKYWNGEGGRFKNMLDITQYIDEFGVPVNLYFNYTDEPVKDIAEVYEYIIRESMGGISDMVDGKYVYHGLDGEEPRQVEYKVTRKEA